MGKLVLHRYSCPQLSVVFVRGVEWDLLGSTTCLRIAVMMCSSKAAVIDGVLAALAGPGSVASRMRSSWAQCVFSFRLSDGLKRRPSIHQRRYHSILSTT